MVSLNGTATKPMPLNSQFTNKCVGNSSTTEGGALIVGLQMNCRNIIKYCLTLVNTLYFLQTSLHTEDLISERSSAKLRESRRIA